MDKVEVKITYEEESGKFVTVIAAGNENDSKMEREAKGIAVTLMWLKMKARSNKRGMLAALTELMRAILHDDDEPKQREITIDGEELMRQIRELKEEAERIRNIILNMKGEEENG